MNTYPALNEISTVFDDQENGDISQQKTLILQCKDAEGADFLEHYRYLLCH
jgi:hypothetical protein